MTHNIAKKFTAETRLNTSPFFERTSKLNQSQEWRRWAGYLSATQYDLQHENEYFAIRTKAALIDISPLYKYIIQGTDAQYFLNYVVTRDIQFCKIGQVMYTPWCDEYGKMIDDGTVQHLDNNKFRLTSAEPNLEWLTKNGMGMDITIKDDSQDTVALALQGPKSREILNNITTSVHSLKYFHLIKTSLNNIPVTISRTGYTGDLGYEIWVSPSRAIEIWDILMEAGFNYGITPAGLHALDIARIEASLILLNVDYIPAQHALIEDRKSSPYELSLAWTVKLKKNNFIGKHALFKERQFPSDWSFRGIEIEWGPLEKYYKNLGLSPSLPLTAWRVSTPIYHHKKQIGYATSGCWSPILKQYIALAHIQTDYAKIGTHINFEIKVEHRRVLTPATIVKTPFYDPERKRSCPK